MLDLLSYSSAPLCSHRNEGYDMTNNARMYTYTCICMCCVFSEAFVNVFFGRAELANKGYGWFHAYPGFFNGRWFRSPNYTSWPAVNDARDDLHCPARYV